MNSSYCPIVPLSLSIFKVFCLENGIGVESVDKDGDTSLDFACMKSKLNAVKVRIFAKRVSEIGRQTDRTTDR